MRYRENYRNKSVEAMQADWRIDREKPPIGPVLLDATTPGYGLTWVWLAGVLAIVGAVLGIMYW